jgi:cellulose synthase/poly-beta-1,6-N-acetylglucosamine synthase-like glycosyltransferase
MMFTALGILTIITCILGIAYLVMTAVFAYGWAKTKTLQGRSSGKISVSVIVAARNEEQQIGDCLQALSRQSYRGKVQFVVADDHSTDTTYAIVKEFCGKDARFVLISPQGTGKKNAVAEAIGHSQGELIVTTDADCTMGSEWLEKIVAFYEHSGAGMIAGPLSFKGETSLFEKLQSLELMALMGSTGGSLYFDKAILCNGANLAYSRSLFEKLNGFVGIDHIASGDDVLLMYKVSRTGEKIRFLKDEDAIVFTSARKDLHEFMEQRKRWASKGFSLLNTETKLVSLIVYFFSFGILSMGVFSALASIKSLIYLPFLQFCLILTGIKCVIDFLLLFLAASFFRKKRQLFLFLPGQFIYIIYVVMAGFLGSTGKYEWKGRKS